MNPGPTPFFFFFFGSNWNLHFQKSVVCSNIFHLIYRRWSLAKNIRSNMPMPCLCIFLWNVEACFVMVFFFSCNGMTRNSHETWCCLWFPTQTETSWRTTAVNTVHWHIEYWLHWMKLLPWSTISTFAPQQEKQCRRDLDLMLKLSKAVAQPSLARPSQTQIKQGSLPKNRATMSPSFSPATFCKARATLLLSLSTSEYECVSPMKWMKGLCGCFLTPSRKPSRML